MKIKLNAKQAMLTMKAKYRPPKDVTVPRHLRHYPNMKFGKNQIIDVEYRATNKLDFSDPDKKVDLGLKPYRTYTRLQAVK
jgi:hypothetical protein